jgi:hypothetical protein
MLSEVVLCAAISCHPAPCAMAEMEGQRNVIPAAYARLFRQINGSVNILGAIDMTDFIRNDFSGVPGVSEVVVNRQGNEFEVQVFLAKFERDLRRKVYAKEEALYREFPSYSFSFNLIDASESNNVLEGTIPG